MKRLDQDLKNGIIKNVYLLYGSQSYLRNQYRDKIVNTIFPDGDRMNYACYSGKEIKYEEIVDLAETMPFLGEHRVIVIENTGFFKDSRDNWADYILTIPETTTIIFSELSVNKSYKFYKNITKSGTAVDFDAVPDDMIVQWTKGKIKKDNKAISQGALVEFLNRTGMDMLNISNELEKLLAYTYNRAEITVKDVEAVCPVRLEDKIYAMMDAIMDKNVELSLKCYGEMLSLQKKPISILGYMESQIRLLYKCRMYIDDGNYDARELATIIGMNEYRVKKALMQAKRSSRIWLRECLDECANAEEAFKSGRLKDQMALELLICTMARG